MSREWLTLPRKVIIGAGTALLVILALFVPWMFTRHTESAPDGYPQGYSRDWPAGYGFIFASPTPPDDRTGVKLDVPRLIIPMAAVVCAAAVSVLLVRGKQALPAHAGVRRRAGRQEQELLKDD